MPLRLDSQSADFPKRFRSLLATKREAAEDVEKVVRGIVSDVAVRGDKALIELTAKFDRQKIENFILAGRIHVLTLA